MINVRPLPVENELPGFQGAVGDYTCDPPILTKSNLKVGEPTQLTIAIHGRGDPARINPPLPSRVEGWQIFPAERSGKAGGRKDAGRELSIHADSLDGRRAHHAGDSVQLFQSRARQLC